MEKYIPHRKLSKRKQREQSRAKRGTWGGLNPVTRTPPNPKAYNRKKARKWSDDSSMTVPFYFMAYRSFYNWGLLTLFSTSPKC